MYKIISIAFLYSFLSPSLIKAGQLDILREDDTLTVSWQTKKFNFKTVPIDEKETARKLFVQSSCQDGLPADFDRFWDNQHASRILGGYTNAHHLFLVKNTNSDVIAIVHFDRMPVFGYNVASTYNPDEHEDILNHWIDLGVVQKIESEGRLDYGNLERVNNSGIATIMPIFATHADYADKAETLKAAAKLLKKLAHANELLPSERKVDVPALEQAKAAWALSVMTPENPLQISYLEVGYSVIDDEWVQKFYDAPRIIVEKKL